MSAEWVLYVSDFIVAIATITNRVAGSTLGVASGAMEFRRNHDLATIPAANSLHLV